MHLSKTHIGTFRRPMISTDESVTFSRHWTMTYPRETCARLMFEMTKTPFVLYNKRRERHATDSMDGLDDGSFFSPQK